MKSDKKEYVSGPYNLVRMEGSINGINKIFYFFMDMHLTENIQMQCKNIRSKPIKQYLVETFDKINNLDKQYDFFLETFPDCYIVKNNRLGNYLNQLRKFFSEAFKFDFKKNKIKQNSEFSNVRFHYIDIRSYLTFQSCNPFSILYQVLDFVHSLEGKLLLPFDITDIHDIVMIATARLDFLYQTLYNPNNVKKVNVVQENYQNLSEYSDEDFKNVIKFLIDKIKNSYIHENIKNKINNYIEKDLKKYFEEYFELAKQFLDYLNKSYDKLNIPQNKLIKYKNFTDYFSQLHGTISREIKEHILETLTKLIDLSFINIYTIIMDLYFLRRALDKDYITNSIIYTGGAHSINYIYSLLKYFNFKITHVHYAKYSIPELTEKILKEKSPDKITNFFLPQYMEQCIEISQFPSLFQ